MGVIRNAANTLIKGRVGQTTYYISGGQQIARQSRNDSNYGETARRSESQQARRVMWANLVNFYKVSAGWMPKAFESRKRNQTDYNKFMQVNMNTSRIALVKDMAAAGACVVDGYIVTLGSLPSVSVTANNAGWSTDIQLGDLVIGSATTVAAFTAAVLANNPQIHKGMQISCVVYAQSIDSYGTPRVDCRLYEVTLDDEDATLLRAHLPELVCTSVDGALSTSSSMPDGGFAYIISELVNGALKVSTQQLVTNNASLITEYSDQRMKELAMYSYGLDPEVVLSPVNTTTQPVEELVPSITDIYVNSVTYAANDYFGPLGNMQNIQNKEIRFINSTGWSLISMAIIPKGGQTISATGLTPKSDGAFYFSANVAGYEELILQRIAARMRKDSTQEEVLLTIDFATTE